MRLPLIHGLIKRRLLVNFRADPAVVQRLLPTPFRPKLHAGFSLVGICLIRLEQIRPKWVPGALGISSENAAHRIAVEWTDDDGIAREGVFIPRRDTGSWLNRVAGGRVFPGEHHAARFTVIDTDGYIDLAMHSLDSAVAVRVVGHDVDTLPAGSCFASLTDASTYFEGGSLGYSVTAEAGRLDGLRLRTLEWRLRALAVTEVSSSYFSDPKKFPVGSITFDHALIMRDLAHEWQEEGNLYTAAVTGDFVERPGR